jgi:hypothetical protein
MQEAGSRTQTARKEAGNKAGSLTDLRLEIAVKYYLSVSSFFQNLLGCSPKVFQEGSVSV